MNEQVTQQVIISGFSDEIAAEKHLDTQFSVLAALGIEYFSIRFVRVNNEIKNAVNLTPQELTFVRQKIEDYGLMVSSLGSPIGKVKLVDQEDGSGNHFFEFDAYLDEHVKPACQIACELGTKLVRGFSFYHPKGSDVLPYLSLATEQIARISEVASSFGLVFGLEVEANLVGHSGWLLADIHQAINSPNLVLIFDGANLVTQGFNSAEVFEQYQAMKPGLGWLHVKDYADSDSAVGDYVDEDALSRYVTVRSGNANYEKIFRDVASDCQLFDRARQLGLPGVFLDLEPHLKGGGQFGGFSGPDGFGLAFRDLCSMLDETGLKFHLRDLSAVKSSIGGGPVT